MCFLSCRYLSLSIYKGDPFSPLHLLFFGFLLSLRLLIGTRDRRSLALIIKFRALATILGVIQCPSSSSCHGCAGSLCLGCCLGYLRRMSCLGCLGCKASLSLQEWCHGCERRHVQLPVVVVTIRATDDQVLQDPVTSPDLLVLILEHIKSCAGLVKLQNFLFHVLDVSLTSVTERTLCGSILGCTTWMGHICSGLGIVVGS